MSNYFPKIKFPIPLQLRYCTFERSRDPTTIMLSLIQRVIRHAFVISKQSFGRTQVLNIGRLQGQGQKVRVNCQALTKNTSNSNTDLFQYVIKSLVGTAREVFITNVLRRNNAIVSPVWQRFGNARPFFGLVGISLATGGKTLTQDFEFESICSEIRNTLKPTKDEPLVDVDLEELESKLPFESLDYIGKGQCGAIYQTILNGEDVAVKVMFNFALQSNSSTILRGMIRELVPSRQRIRGIDFGDTGRVPSHPNIVDIKCVLTSKNVQLPGAKEHWPDALPSNLNGYGRNMTMYIVMAKYDADLQAFLRNTKLSSRERILILAQMLEGVSHLKKYGVAHRDLKADNFLVTVKDYPHVVITDFGHCHASKKNPLQLPYRTEDMEIGGNAALQAPELVTATPGTFKWLSYEHSDTWAVGAIAYEVFGYENPFYFNLNSKDYDEKDLPHIQIENENAPSIIDRVVKGLLKRNPRDRLSCELASTILYVYVWGPRNWLRKADYHVGDVEILRWLMLLTTKVVWNNSEASEMNLIQTFLRRVTYVDVRKALEFFRH